MMLFFRQFCRRVLALGWKQNVAKTAEELSAQHEAPARRILGVFRLVYDLIESSVERILTWQPRRSIVTEPTDFSCRKFR